jgi:protein dithiol oxidoreductase (disulfide-forming)
MRVLSSLFTVVIAAMAMTGSAQAQDRWVEGQHYFRVQPAQPTSVPAGKVEVIEVLSYGCPACYQFLPYAAQLKTRLPAQAQLIFAHASFNAAEQWPMFQRAFYTAQQLHLVEKTHEAMFRAVWGPNGELAIADPATGRIKTPPPSIEDVASFYAKVAGITPKQFLDTSKSFAVDMSIRRAESFMKAAHVDQTPTIVVNGKYRLNVTTAGGPNQLLELVNYLVQKEAQTSSTAR